MRLAKSPRDTLLIAASAVATNLLFSTCLALCLRAYGGELPFATIVVVNWAASTLGGLSPTPGGLGVAEAGLVAGPDRGRHPNRHRRSRCADAPPADVLAAAHRGLDRHAAAPSGRLI